MLSTRSLPDIVVNFFVGMLGGTITGYIAYLFGLLKAQNDNYDWQLKHLVEQLEELQDLCTKYYTNSVDSPSWELDGLNMMNRVTRLVKDEERWKPVFGSKYYKVCFEMPMDAVYYGVTGMDFQSKTRSHPEQTQVSSAAIQLAITHAQSRLMDIHSVNPFRRMGFDRPT